MSWMVNALLIAAGLTSPIEASPPQVSRNEVRLDAECDISRFQGLAARWGGMDGYHFLVFAKGGAADRALFITETSERAFYDALVQAGAKPGSHLGMETWERRKDANAEAPNRRVEGSGIEISLTWSGSDHELGLSDLLDDPGGKGMDLRFAGHLENAPVWKSGCLVCLYSCPGGKVGNRSYTVRDFVEGKTTFRVKEGLEIPRSVQLILRVTESD